MGPCYSYGELQWTYEIFKTLTTYIFVDSFYVELTHIFLFILDCIFEKIYN